MHAVQQVPYSAIPALTSIEWAEVFRLPGRSGANVDADSLLEDDNFMRWIQWLLG